MEFDRPERLVVAGTSDRMDIDTAYIFTGANGGTRVVVSTDVRPKGLASVLSPLLRLFCDVSWRRSTRPSSRPARASPTRPRAEPVSGGEPPAVARGAGVNLAHTVAPVFGTSDDCARRIGTAPAGHAALPLAARRQWTGSPRPAVMSDGCRPFRRSTSEGPTCQKGSSDRSSPLRPPHYSLDSRCGRQTSSEAPSR